MCTLLAGVLVVLQPSLVHLSSLLRGALLRQGKNIAKIGAQCGDRFPFSPVLPSAPSAAPAPFVRLCRMPPIPRPVSILLPNHPIHTLDCDCDLDPQRFHFSHHPKGLPIQGLAGTLDGVWGTRRRRSNSNCRAQHGKLVLQR